MTLAEAIEYVRSCGEQDGPDSYEDAAELFAAIFGRRPDADDGDAGELWSHVCAAIDDADEVRLPDGASTAHLLARPMTTPPPRSASTVAQMILAQLGAERSGHPARPLSLSELEPLAREFLRLTRPDQATMLGTQPYIVSPDAVSEYGTVMRVYDDEQALRELTVLMHGARRSGKDERRWRAPAPRGGDVAATVETVTTGVGQLRVVVDTTTRESGRSGRGR